MGKPGRDDKGSALVCTYKSEGWWDLDFTLACFMLSCMIRGQYGVRVSQQSHKVTSIGGGVAQGDAPWYSVRTVWTLSL